MIVEIYGPPCAGKTTLARALCARLRECGAAVELASSYRPYERPVMADAASPRRRLFASAARFTRPLRELVRSAQGPSSDSREATIGRQLLRLMPPTGPLWSIRLRQYIRRFSSTWYRADDRDEIVIFDQAFVQVVCSLALLTAPRNRCRVGEALHLIPKPDLLIRLTVPTEVLTTRNKERERRQSWVDWLLEFDLETNLRSADVLERCEELLRRQGVASIEIEASDTEALDQAVQRIARAVLVQSHAARISA